MKNPLSVVSLTAQSLLFSLLGVLPLVALAAVTYDQLRALPELDARTLPAARADATAVARSAIGLSLLWSALVVLGSYFAARSLTRRIGALISAADSLARGGQPPRLEVTERGDEVNQLTRRFNEMAEAISNTKRTLEGTVQERTAALEKLLVDLLAQLRVHEVQGEELRSRQHELAQKNIEVERANRLKSDFLANTSHELRTPLNSVIGFADLVLDEATLEPHHRKYLDSVVKAGRHLLSLINGILDLAKIESEHVTLVRTPLSAAAAVSEACDVAGGQSHKKQIALVQDISPSCTVLADAGKLRQVLLNLLSNAIKFSPQGSRITIRAREQDAMVVFQVDDEGPGVAAALLPHLFTPFTQSKNSLGKRHGGTGLGLAISKKIVELHGGTIEFDRAPGGGARFSFCLPAARPPPSAAPRGPDDGHPPAHALEHLIESGGYRAPPVLESEEPAPPVALASKDLSPQGRAAPTSRSTGTIVVIDDHEPNREFARSILERQGYRVAVAENGISGMEAVRRELPDLVLMDLAMPEMDGYASTQALKADPATHHIVIVALTALAMRDDQEKARSVDVDDYLTKPIDRKALEDTVARLVPDAQRRRKSKN